MFHTRVKLRYLITEVASLSDSHNPIACFFPHLRNSVHITITLDHVNNNKSILPIQKLEQNFLIIKKIFNSGQASPNLSPQNTVEYLGNNLLALKDKM